MIALLSARDPAYIHEAARRGVFAYIVDADAEELQSAIDITLQRFAEYHNLQGAFGRRAVIEQAKGILMACHAIDQERAFEMLRSHSQRNGRKLIDVAEAVVESHLLLLRRRCPRHSPKHAWTSGAEVSSCRMRVGNDFHRSCRQAQLVLEQAAHNVPDECGTGMP